MSTHYAILTGRVTGRSLPFSLLNRDTIRTSLLAEAPWAESHGADHNAYLGAGLLYYSFAYAFQSQTIVVLGSGGGFVPRLLKQAQRDLELSGAVQDKALDLILVDAHFPEAGYGSTFYAENEDTIMRQQFRDIRYVFQKTDDAFVMLKRWRDPDRLPSRWCRSFVWAKLERLWKLFSAIESAWRCEFSRYLLRRKAQMSHGCAANNREAPKIH